MKPPPWTAWLPVAIFALVLLANLPFCLSPDLIERGDQAANALQIERARSFDELLGPYSRYEFHHPGPVAFYYLAASEVLFFWVPSFLGKHLLAQFVVNLSWLAAVAWLGRRLGLGPLSRVLLWFALPLQFIALSGGTPLLLTSVWGPLVVVLPLTVFILCVALLARGELDRLPLAVLSSVVAVHNHLGTLAVVAPLSLFAVTGLVLHLRRAGGAFRGRRLAAPLLLAVIIALLGVLPPVYEELTVEEGNLSKIAAFVGEGTGAVHGWREIVQKLGHALTDPLVVFLRGSPLAHHGPLPVFVLLGWLVTTTGWAFSRADAHRRTLIVLLWLALVCAVVSAAHTRDQLMPYLFFYTYGPVAVLFVIGVAPLGEILARRWPSCPRSPQFWALLGLLPLLWWIPTHRIVPPGPYDHYEQIRARFDLRVEDDLHLCVVRDEVDGSLWREATGLALSLSRKGVRVTVPDEWVFMYGEDLRRGGEPSTGVLVLTRRRAPATDLAVCELGEFRAVFSRAPGATATELLAGFE